MRITALVENRSDCALTPKHGLSLYIETAKHKILFDVGPDDTLFKNCVKRGIDLKKVDTVILSHGHDDHGGGLARFLKINDTAKIYAQRKAFDNHSLKILFFRINIGVDAALAAHPQVVLLDGDCKIDDELTVFTVTDQNRYPAGANKKLYAGRERDDFTHEQNLIICDENGENTLIMGCGHAGVVTILEKAQAFTPRLCVGGFHLWNVDTKKTEPEPLLSEIAQALAKYDMQYYTCHCTGVKAYRYFKARLPGMHYLSCGETIGE